MLIPIDKIKISPDRRETVPAQVEKLAQSISELGLLNSITVDQDYTLIAGLHRIEAAKRLGWTEIECNVTSLAGLQAKLAEIDENIVRCDFSSMESNELLLRRKEIYESLHPETQQGKRNRMTSKNEDRERQVEIVFRWQNEYEWLVGVFSRSGLFSSEKEAV